MPDAILEVFALLGRLSEDSIFTERARVRADEIFLSKVPAKEERFAKLYLELESELLKKVKGTLSPERVRAQAFELLKNTGAYPAFRVLLLEPNLQTLALASALLAAYAERSQLFFGPRITSAIVMHALDETPWKGVKIDLARGIAHQPEHMRTPAEAGEIVSTLFARWYDRLHVTFGEATSRKLFERAFHDVEEVFGFLPVMKRLLGLTPKTVLWAEKAERLHELENETVLQAKGLRTADQDLQRQAEHLRATVAELEETRRQLEATARARSEFIDVVSHQFRTPLSTIRWSAEVLGDAAREKRFDPEVREAVETVRQKSVYLSETLERVFAALDIETGKFRIDPKPAFLWELVQDARDRAEKDFTRYQMRWKFERSKNQLRELPIDKAKIAFALKILIDNALTYGKRGGMITAGVIEKTLDGAPHLVCAIADDGIGMAKDEMARVFEKFFRSQRAVLVSPDGAGLGMFIVKHIIEAHGGTVWVESEGENKGTTVFFALPLKA